MQSKTYHLFFYDMKSLNNMSHRLLSSVFFCSHLNGTITLSDLLPLTVFGMHPILCRFVSIHLVFLFCSPTPLMIDFKCNAVCFQCDIACTLFTILLFVTSSHLFSPPCIDLLSHLYKHVSTPKLIFWRARVFSTLQNHIILSVVTFLLCILTG